jgi:hypothetical protein
MVRRVAAVWLVLVVLAPFTAPFSPYDFHARPESGRRSAQLSSAAARTQA